MVLRQRRVFGRFYISGEESNREKAKLEQQLIHSTVHDVLHVYGFEQGLRGGFNNPRLFQYILL